MAKLMDIEVDDYLKSCVELNDAAISEEFSRLSADYAYWNEKYSVANRAHLKAEWEEEKLAAQLYLRFKEPREGLKPPTEATVDAAVKTDPGFEARHLATLEAQAERDYLRGVLEALRTKREMAVSLGATLRQENEGDARMMDRNALKRSADDFR